MSDLIQTPPTPILGIEYEWLSDDKVCGECTRLVKAGQIVVKRNARGRAFAGILRAKTGVCLECSADALSAMSVQQYENVLHQINAYEAMSEKAELTENEIKQKKFLERFIQKLTTFIQELSDFNKYVEDTGVEYYAQNDEDDDDE